MKNIILIGLPGSGKGTQSKKLVEKFGFEHISTGDLIREEQLNETTIGDLAKRMSDQGLYLPDDIISTLVKQKIIDSKNTVGFIFDGYPRTVDQAKTLDGFLYNRKTPINYIINLVVSDNIVVNRINERAEIENRVDDKSELIPVRLKMYKEKTTPVISYFKARKSIIEINGEKDTEEVFSDIKAVIV
jgi:adenylate kinase